MMVLIGSFHVIQGLVALFNDEYYLVGKSGLTVQVDYTVWGWTHIVAGVLIMCAGFGLLAGQMWARDEQIRHIGR
jgi:sulfite exporter TauE/SafE